MDLAAISSAYTALKAMKEVGTRLLEAKVDKETEKKVGEAFDKIGAVQDTLFYMREEMSRLQDENREFKDKARVLEEKLKTKEGMIYKAPSYWLQKDGTEDGPFCQKCFDANQKLIRLQGGKNDYWVCKECTSHYAGPNYRPVEAKIISSGARWSDRLRGY